MLRSMTGIGISNGSFEETELTVEIKSVNHRYLDVSFRMPNLLNIWEKDFRDLITKSIRRGKVNVVISFENIGKFFTNVTVDLPLAKHYYNALKLLSSELRLPNEVTVIDFLSMKGIFDLKNKNPDDELKFFIFQQLTKALDNIISMKQEEGRHIEEDIVGRLNILRDIIEEIDKSKKLIIEKHKKKLEENIKKTFGKERDLINEKRVEFEITQFADRVDITEEIVRFKSHVEKFFKTLNESGSVGKKLDFILQELNREANTISSKNNLTELSDKIIELKTEIEKIREQVQNVE